MLSGVGYGAVLHPNNDKGINKIRVITTMWYDLDDIFIVLTSLADFYYEEACSICRCWITVPCVHALVFVKQKRTREKKISLQKTVKTNVFTNEVKRPHLFFESTRKTTPTITATPKEEKKERNWVSFLKKRQRDSEGKQLLLSKSSKK